METPSMVRCREFLEALQRLTQAEWQARATATRAPASTTLAAMRRELERHCDAYELWSLRDDVETLCWRLPPHERAWLREAIADAALAILAGASVNDGPAGALLTTFADLVPASSASVD